ncbi:MAG: hypothetical protein HRF42_10450 [Candidatus Brocadia sp.]|jgi:hypothetical protein
MINNVNPSASRLLEQIKRLSMHTTQKEMNPPAFRKDVLNNRTYSIPKGTNLSNTERVLKRNEAYNHLTEGENVQMLERLRPLNAETNLRREPVGSFLDIYL